MIARIVHHPDFRAHDFPSWRRLKRLSAMGSTLPVHSATYEVKKRVGKKKDGVVAVTKQTFYHVPLKEHLVSIINLPSLANHLFFAALPHGSETSFGFMSAPICASSSLLTISSFNCNGFTCVLGDFIRLHGSSDIWRLEECVVLDSSESVPEPSLRLTATKFVRLVDFDVARASESSPNELLRSATSKFISVTDIESVVRVRLEVSDANKFYIGKSEVGPRAIAIDHRPRYYVSVNNPNRLPLLKIGLLVYIDAFVAFVRMALAPRGMYLSLVNMSDAARRKICNIFVSGIAPKSASPAILWRCVKEQLIELQDGIDVNYKGKSYRLVTSLVATVADSPQASENSGVSAPNGHTLHPCRFCPDDRAQLAESSRDRIPRTKSWTLDALSRADITKKGERAQFLKDRGINKNGLELFDPRLHFDAHIQAPHDLSHLLFGSSGIVMKLTTTLITALGTTQTPLFFKMLCLPPGTPAFPSVERIEHWPQYVLRGLLSLVVASLSVFSSLFPTDVATQAAAAFCSLVALRKAISSGDPSAIRLHALQLHSALEVALDAAMMRHTNVHILLHLADEAASFGDLHRLVTDHFETAHKLQQEAYKHTNGTNRDLQVLRVQLERLSARHVVEGAKCGEGYVFGMQQRLGEDARALLASRYFTEQFEFDDILEQATSPRLLHPLSSEITPACRAALTRALRRDLQVRSLTLRSVTAYGAIESRSLRVRVGKDVSIRGNDGSEWYGRIVGLFQASDDHNGSSSTSSLWVKVGWFKKSSIKCAIDSGFPLFTLQPSKDTYSHFQQWGTINRTVHMAHRCALSGPSACSIVDKDERSQVVHASTNRSYMLNLHMD